jgi:hypothetical protein
MVFSDATVYLRQGFILMNIWHIENKRGRQLTLWRTGKDTFCVTIDGDYTSLLENGNYILIDKKYSTLLEQVADQVTFQSVKVSDYGLKTETDKYIELNIINTIDPVSAKLIDKMGLKIWKAFGSYVFVSDELKEALTKINPKDFDFSLGFSHFGG